MTWTPVGTGQRMIDLTHPLAGQAPSYPGQPPATFTAVTAVADDGYLVSEVHSRTHIGTHADTPAHFLADGETTFDIGLERWMGPAWVTRVAEHEPSGEIGAAMLTLPSEPARILLISTGHSRWWGTDRYYGQAPYLTAEAAEQIRDAGFGLVGLDFPSPDRVGSATEPCHHILLRAGTLIIENLSGLDRLDPGPCWFCAAPLLIGGGDGGFCRAFAVAPGDSTAPGASGPA
jgi:kynurenine formamidase